MSTAYIRDDPIIMLHDLTPRKDPKGGSPKTPPGGIRLPKISTPYPPYATADLTQHQRWYQRIQFRDVLHALSLITVALLFFLQRIFDVHDLTFKVNATEKAQAAYEKVQEQMSATLSAQQKLIDSNATGLQLQAAANIERDKRIAEAQTQLLMLVPDVREIKTKLNIVVELMDQRSKQKP